MSNQDALGDRRRHTLTGSVSQIPFAFYFAPRPQVSTGSSVGRSKSCSKDVKFRPRPTSTSGSGSAPSSHKMSTERPDAIQSKAMIEVKGHGNNVLKKKRRTSRASSVQESRIPRAPSFDMVQMASRPGTSPTTNNWTRKSAHLPVAIPGSMSSSGAISASTANVLPHHPKQKSLWLNRKASYLPDSKPFPTPPPPPKILMKPSPSSLSLVASLTSSSTATLTTLSPKSKAVHSSSASTKIKTKSRRPPSPDRLTSALTPSSSSLLTQYANNPSALNVPDHSNSHHRGRTASIATSLSMYSQKSYPHHMQLPEQEDDNRLGTKDWFLVEDEDVDSALGLSFAPVKRSEQLGEGGQTEYHGKGKRRINGTSDSVALGSESSSRNGKRSQRRTRSRSRSRARTQSRHRAASSKSVSSNSNSNSRCTSPTYPIPGPQPQYLEVPPRSPRRHRHHRKRSTDTAFTTVTCATTSTSATTSTTSGWRKDIAEVKEGMKSFLDMSVSGSDGGLGLGDIGVHNRESQWFELEVPSESESRLTPVSTMTETPPMPLTVKSKKSRSKSNSKPKSSWKAPCSSSPYSHSRSSSTSNHLGPAPAHTAFLGSSISDRYSNVLPRSPSPSPAPTLSYVVFEDHNEEMKARYPALSFPSPNSLSADSNSYLPSPSLPPYSPNETGLDKTVDDNQAHLNSLQLDYDYSFAVDVLVHVPESLVDPSFRGNVTKSVHKSHGRKASVSASIRVNLRPEEISGLTKSGTIRRSNSNKAKKKKGPKLSRSKWSFGNGNKANVAPANEVVGNIAVAGRGIEAVFKKEKKKSLVLQVTNFFTRV